MAGFLYSNFEPKLTTDYKVLYSSRLFFQKFGYPPTVCYVNPEDFTGLIGDLDPDRQDYKIVHGLMVKPDKLVKKDYFMLREVEVVGSK